MTIKGYYSMTIHTMLTNDLSPPTLITLSSAATLLANV